MDNKKNYNAKKEFLSEEKEVLSNDEEVIPEEEMELSEEESADFIRFCNEQSLKESQVEDSLLD